MIIGLTGTYAAGKGTVAELLEARDFAYHSLSDVLREELARQGVAESRRALFELGNRLRREEGAGALAQRIRPRLRQQERAIVDSIRNPAEVRELRELPDFLLLGVDASPEIRFERLRQRGRGGDPESWEDFRALEDREIRGGEDSDQQLERTASLADRVVRNDGGVDELAASLDAVLREQGLA